MNVNDYLKDELKRLNRMNDLIDNPALVEDYTVKEKSEGENNE